MSQKFEIPRLSNFRLGNFLCASDPVYLWTQNLEVKSPLPYESITLIAFDFCPSLVCSGIFLSLRSLSQVGHGSGHGTGKIPLLAHSGTETDICGSEYGVGAKRPSTVPPRRAHARTEFVGHVGHRRRGTPHVMLALGGSIRGGGPA